MLEEHVKEYVKDDADCMNVITLAESVEVIQKELHKIKSIMSKQLKNTTDYISWSEDDWLSAINNFRYNCIVSLLQQFSTDILNDYDVRDIILSVVGKIDINIDDDDFTLLTIPETNIALSMKTKGDRIEIF